MIEAKMPILHDGRLYREGEIITDITPEQATLLVEVGSADWQRVRPDFPTSAQESAVRNAPSGFHANVDWEERVKKYHRGFGNYDIPGVGMVKGKDAAIEALKTAQEKGVITGGEQTDQRQSSSRQDRATLRSRDTESC